MTKRVWSWVFAGLIVASMAARADEIPFVPQGLPHQGRLLTGNDQPVTGQVDMTFSLYHQATEGTPVWTEEKTVQVDNGYYALILGDPSDQSVQPITDADLTGPTYLAITVDQNEMSPRLQLGTVPYAERADRANSIDGGTISNATITSSSLDATQVSIGGHTIIDGSGNVDATSVSVGGNTVIDSSGNLNGKPMSDYVTNDSLTQSYATSADLSQQGYDNLVRNGSFEIGQAGQLPTDWSAVGTGNGTRAQVADPLFGASALEVNDTDTTAQVAVQQVVIASGAVAAYAGDTFTASVYAKKKSGAPGRFGRICLVEADAGASGAMDCAALTGDSAYARASVSHVVSGSATYLAVLLDSGTVAGDANDYVFDGVMMTQGKLAVSFAPSVAEQVPSELPDRSIPDAALPADVALLDAPSDPFTGDLSAKSFTGSGSGLTGVPDAALSANIPRIDATTNAFTGDLSAKSFSGSGSGLTGVPDAALSANIPRLDATTNAFTGTLTMSGNVGIGVTTPGSALQIGASGTSGSASSVITFGITGSNPQGYSNLPILGETNDVFGGNSLVASATSNSGGLIFDTFDGTSEGARMVISPPGNVGIGTMNPRARLDVYENVSNLAAGTWEANPGLAVGNTSATGTKYLFAGVDQGADYGYLGAVDQGKNYIPLSINPGGGNVGIGTTSPAAKLDVNGSIQTSGGITTTATDAGGDGIFTYWRTGPTINGCSGTNTITSAMMDAALGNGIYYCMMWANWAVSPGIFTYVHQAGAGARFGKVTEAGDWNCPSTCGETTTDWSTGVTYTHSDGGCGDNLYTRCVKIQ